MQNDLEHINKQRRKDIDIAKAIGIIMVVWAHADAPFNNFINAFHMPMFFFLSGMVFKYNDNYKDFLLKKVKSLLFPFWGWNLLLVVPFWFFYYWKQWDIKILLGYLFRIIITIDKVPMLGATWFLPALFFTSAIFCLFYKILHKNRFSDFILIILSSIVLFIGIVYTFPYRISRTLICSFFFVLGYIFNKYLNSFIEKQFDNLKGILISNITALICFIGFIFLTNHNTIIIGYNNIEYPLLFIIGSIFAIYSVIVLSKNLSKLDNGIIKHIIYLGKNTMPIVIWQFVFFRITIIIQIIIYKVSFKNLFAFPMYDSSKLWWIAYILSGIYGSIFWGMILDKIFKKIKTKIKN